MEHENFQRVGPRPVERVTWQVEWAKHPECLERLGVWPDGKHMDGWDVVADDVTWSEPQKAWAQQIWKKIANCVIAEWAPRARVEMMLLALLPPLGLLFIGFVP